MSDHEDAMGTKVYAELESLLAEVRSLRQDIEILKVNPAIGDAVSAALRHAREFPESHYNVAVVPGRPFRRKVLEELEEE